MGAGNWSWRSSTGLSTFVVHVDSAPSGFDEYREQAEKGFVSHLEAQHANLIPKDAEPTLDWAQDNGLTSIIEDAIGGEYPYWDNETGFYANASEERFDEVICALSRNGEMTRQSDLRRTAVDEGAVVLDSGKYVQLLMREWETYIYLAVGPTDQVEEELPREPFDAKAELFVAKCLAACVPSKTTFHQVAGKPAAIALTDHEHLLVKDGRVVAAAERVISRITAAAHVLNDNPDAAREAKFLLDFGITVSDLYVRDDDVANVLDFVERLRELPSTVIAQYDTEYAQMRDTMMGRLASLEYKPAMPDTAWTSKVVDMRAYRHAAAIQLDGPGVASFLWNEGSPMDVMGRVAPGCISVMSEAAFDDVVLGKITEHYPHKARVTSNGYFTLYTTGATPSQQEGVLVFRGHRDWGHLQTAEARTEGWIKAGGTATREQLPVWFDYVPASGVREVLASLPAPSSVVKSFFDANGDLKVTGMLVERRGDEMGQVFVTESLAPNTDRAQFRPVLVNGVWNEPSPQLANEKGVGHGR